jgi:hypothetical protein
MLMRRALTFVLLLPFAMACDNSDSSAPGPPPTGPSIPTIGGTYASSTMWVFEQVRGDGGTTALTCAGGLTIATQLADAFSGSFFVNDPTNCGTAGGSVVSGTLRTDGGVTFGLTGQGDSNFLVAAFGCTYVSGDTTMTGAINGNNLRAQSSTRADCPGMGEITINVRVDGNRSQ